MTTAETHEKQARLSVAPMMDWTDRHCRYFHRLLSRETLLYTEMVTAAAVIHGDPTRLLAYDPTEHPVAVQLGGSDPQLLAAAARIAAGMGFDEINLNVGCPSDRVQSGAFGAVLMKDPGLVRDCVAAMLDAVLDTRISVKCRIGVDDQTPAEVLPRFLEVVAQSGVRHFTIHARMAWLQGLSPKENRDIPPLDYPLVTAMKARFPELVIGINGGIASLEEARSHLDAGLDSVMIGRAAYHDPAAILLAADAEIFGAEQRFERMEDAILAFLPYMERECVAGTRLNAMTRHILGAFNGRPGARQWRRILSEGAHVKDMGPELVEHALGALGVRAA